MGARQRPKYSTRVAAFAAAPLPLSVRLGRLSVMRVVAFDVGRRRTGVAVSDVTATLARPLARLDGVQPVEEAVALVEQILAEDGVSAVVVGWPRRLDGSPNELTEAAVRFADALRARLPVPVVLQDERLSSVEAESRLAVRERDWRRRKVRLDAAAAAVILQDYLDHAGPPASDAGRGPEDEAP